MTDSRQSANRALLVKLTVIVVAMFGFGFALVPFYDKICAATGLRDIDQADQVKNSQVDYARTVNIEFDANVRKLPWTFKPLETLHPVHPGEIVQVVYEISNPTDRKVIGQAIPSYGPQQAAQYFRKLECFCFSRQVLQPHETRRMPVVFVVDPALPKDINTITLSYTFFEVEDGSGA
ncbi:MAG TPA: cytochrome c oxidase assembly protein [Casimicrobiaceae bacterium]|nr:cytochrome c oxidase assembly protein [Casimicrobiaceae bacterium]